MSTPTDTVRAALAEGACANTDRELWRERFGDFYADSIHVTAEGSIGMNCGGSVIVMPLRKWHALAAQPAAPAQLCMCKDRPLSECPGEWERGCDLGANEKFVGVAAPAQPEPVAYRYKGAGWERWLHRTEPPDNAHHEFIVEPLYATPPAPKPLTLTSGEIARCMVMVSDPLLWGRMGDQCGVIAEEFARAVLAAAEQKP